MEIEVLHSCIVIAQGHTKRRYIGYTKREAIADFKLVLKGERL
jgi:hypothetical protein